MDGCQCFLMCHRAAWISYPLYWLHACNLFYSLWDFETARVETLSYPHFANPLLFPSLFFTVNLFFPYIPTDLIKDFYLYLPILLD